MTNWWGADFITPNLWVTSLKLQKAWKKKRKKIPERDLSAFVSGRRRTRGRRGSLHTGASRFESSHHLAAGSRQTAGGIDCWPVRATLQRSGSEQCCNTLLFRCALNACHRAKDVQNLDLSGMFLTFSVAINKIPNPSSLLYAKHWSSGRNRHPQQQLLDRPGAEFKSLMFLVAGFFLKR